MADPLQVHSSLDTLADHYAVFEPDQVLTHGQLNSVADFLGDQMRLSRVALAGVGLIAGLHVSRSGAGVQVTRGLGVSTDGDLLMLGTDTTYDRFRPYDSTAPVYRPFYRGAAADGTPTDIWCWPSWCRWARATCWRARSPTSPGAWPTRPCCC
jgi:hypothetical protein